MRVRAFAAWMPLRDAAASAPPADGWRRWTAGALTVDYVPRDTDAAAAPSPTALGSLPDLVLGDDAEWDAAHPARNMAGGAAVRFDAASRTLHLHTSIVGLPPIYRFQGSGVVAFASDLHLLSRLPGVRLALDPVGVNELGRFGHPVGQRTLFRDVELLAPSHEVTLGPDGRTAAVRSWTLPPASPLPWPEFIEAQVRAFQAAVHRLDLSRTFLSLTAGLDTRTVLASLAREGRLVPAVTMSGARPSLDARIAARLARAYGFPHALVTFDERFTRELPRYVETASRLSGGVASLAQAPEVHLYDQVGAGYSARLSGNLGNQVGRGGTEGVSVRNADTAILGAGLRHASGDGHWLLGKLDGDERSRLSFILEAEIAWSSVANYSVGDHFAAQQSPYADRALIETLAARPVRARSAPSGSMLHMRMRDLKHRFLGEPESASFQRTLVHRIGGAAATIPVNWGWRPVGGVSPSGLALGVATLAGMAARAKGLDDGLLRAPLRWSGLPALHDFHESRRWLREDLKPFVLDTLGAQRVREAGLFDATALARLLDAHFAGGADHYASVTFALDVALAHAQFCDVREGRA